MDSPKCMTAVKPKKRSTDWTVLKLRDVKYPLKNLTSIHHLNFALKATYRRKSRKFQYVAIYILTGLLIYTLSHLILKLTGDHLRTAAWYIGVTLSGYLLMLAGGNQLSRLLNINLTKDIFNTDNETFPQEERLLENEYSVNLPARYQLKNKLKQSWINIINPFRGLLVLGTPGAGKSYFVIRHIIEQHLKKGYTMFLYDFKFDDLSIIAYNALRKHFKKFKVKTSFYMIDLDDPKHRCNPLDPQSMEDLTDANEASRTIMLGLNREWIKK